MHPFFLHCKTHAPALDVEALAAKRESGMPAVRVEEHAEGIRVVAGAWTVEHHARHGGCWTSLLIGGIEWLRGPACGSLRFVQPAPGSPTGIFSAFSECNDPAPRLRTETSAAGVVSVIAEGTFRDAQGKTIPVGYRRRTEYHEHGLIWTTLEFLSDSGCDDVVEVRALEVPLAPGLSEAFVRFHPTQAGGADLLGGRARYDLSHAANPTAFLARFTPLQISLKRTNGAGIDLFPGSDLAQWDTTFKPDAGLGHYAVSRVAAGDLLELSPYCMAFRRNKIKVQGAPALRLGIALPSAQREAPKTAVISSPATRDSEISVLAAKGVKVLRYSDSFREGPAFWRNGQHPPYDESGMRELARVIETAHRHGMKIIPTISLKELHPDVPAFSTHARAWMHQAAPSLDLIHNWNGSGESGALMCLKSGWFDYLKAHIETVLTALPWDGLYLDAATPYPCCHPMHSRGAYHSDLEPLIDFFTFARQRVRDGLLGLNTADSPSVFAANIADMGEL
jgi:hypothetical protein